MYLWIEMSLDCSLFMVIRVDIFYMENFLNGNFIAPRSEKVSFRYKERKIKIWGWSDFAWPTPKTSIDDMEFFSNFSFFFHFFFSFERVVWLESTNIAKINKYWAISYQIALNSLQNLWFFFAKIDYFHMKFTIPTITHRKKYHFHFLWRKSAQWDQNKSIWYIDHSSMSISLVFTHVQSSSSLKSFVGRFSVQRFMTFDG